MNTKPVLLYILSLIAFFLLGCVIALGLYTYDTCAQHITPLQGGQTIDFSAYGFSLTVPEGYSLNDYTTNNHAEGGSALFAGCAYTEGEELYLFCYENESGDNLADYEEQQVVSYYMSAGATHVRMRTFGDRPFIEYLMSVDTPEGEELWYTYETWNEDIQITFETQMAQSAVLPILATIRFTSALE